MSSEELQRQTDLDKQNLNGFRSLVARLRDPDGVIPFVGAGMSVDFGFRQWGPFLLEQAESAHVVDEVKALLSRGLFEEAAELVMTTLEPGAFQFAMEDEFGDHKLEGAQLTGAVCLLPALTKRQVITTNFDHALEWVFRKAGPEFDFKSVISGARTQAVSKALRQGAGVLIKIHGDVEESDARVLTKTEYDRHYGTADPENIASTRLTEMMRMLLTRPLLFLGCSLESDRVVAMLKRLFVDLHGGMEHFAIVAAPPSPEALLKRRRELGKMGIRPIWYPEGKYSQIQERLAEVVERASLGVAARRQLRDRPTEPAMSEAEIESAYWDGVAALRARRYDTALETLRRVASVKPDYKQVQSKLNEAEREHRRAQLESVARAAEDASDWREAGEALDTLLQLYPGDQDLADRRDYIRRKTELQNLWEETGELYKRQNWTAVVESFQEMQKIEPDLPDTEGWLAEAQRRLKEQEVRGLIRVHLQEGTEQFEAEQWAKALSALHRVLELEPTHETARALYSQARAKVAEAEAAELLDNRYKKATRAIDASEWEQAIELLKAVTREDPAYKDAPVLLDKATEELANSQAELDVTLSVKPSPVPPDNEATWTLKIRNAGRVTISDIIARERNGDPTDRPPLENPFSLKAGELKRISFTTQHTNRGARRHIEVEGTTPNGRRVSADVKASVNIAKPVKPVATQTVADSETVVPEFIGVIPVTPAPPPVQAVAFRQALRRAKDDAALGDDLAHHLIHLLEEGERHYRIAIESLRRPPDWEKRVEEWQEETAGLKLDTVVWVSLGPPAPQTILENMRRLSREIRQRIGIDIPVQPLEALASGRMGSYGI